MKSTITGLNHLRGHLLYASRNHINLQSLFSGITSGSIKVVQPSAVVRNFKSKTTRLDILNHIFMFVSGYPQCASRGYQHFLLGPRWFL